MLKIKNFQRTNIVTKSYLKKNNTIILKTISAFREWRASVNGTIGFVPTLGGLHNGHLSLIKKSMISCNYTIVSLFLNPLQFGKDEDLKTYPCNLDDDLKKISTLNVSVVFLPNADELLISTQSVFVNENNFSSCIEGQRRPGFFSGVLTIVAKLFNIVNPSHSFFGKKDPQQLLLIKKLCDELNFNINIIACPTIREKNGVALSSRNKYLTPDELENASVIYNSLKKAQHMIKNNIFSISKVRYEMTSLLLGCPNLKIDYISFSDAETLEELSENIANNTLISIAVFIGKTRLIDSFFYPDI